jgi:hypothetical protein
MKTVLIIAGVVALAAAAVLWVCAKALNEVAKEEEQDLRLQIEDERLTCGLIEEE